MNSRISKFVCLQRDWRDSLGHLLASAERELLICSPYITSEGIRFVEECSRIELRQKGKCTVVTNLAPTNVVQGATDPRALQRLSHSISNTAFWHLPRLHAKVYVADASAAIVTSANLTLGGVRANYEYGVHVADVDTVAQIRNDIIGYSELGTRLTDGQLSRYIEVADEVRAAFEKQQRSISRTAKARFEQLFYKAENELIALRLAGAPVTQVFARTIEYLLRRHGAMTTPEIHSHIAEIHPDLCDDTVDRVIDGRHFGKKWKNLVRTAQSQLKVRSVIELSGGRWKLVDQV
jgi:hypothetical protein